MTVGGGGGGSSDFLGSEILTKSEFLGLNKKMPGFFGVVKKTEIFMGCEKRTKGFFGVC